MNIFDLRLAALADVELADNTEGVLYIVIAVLSGGSVNVHVNSVLLYKYSAF